MHRIARTAPLGDPRVQHGRYQRVADLRAVEARQPALRLRARPPAARAPSCRCRRSPPTPASRRRTWRPTGSTAASSGGIASILDGAIKLVSPNTAAQGAWPTLMAATADLPGATYVGPDGLAEWGGRPRVPPATSCRTTRPRSAGCGRSARRPPASPTPDQRAWLYEDLNVLGSELQPCGTDPLTGFFRDGCRNTGPEDLGSHTICAVVTAEFLEHQRGIGNDLSTPMPQYRLPRAGAR